jgi:hypothetical protein
LSVDWGEVVHATVAGATGGALAGATGGTSLIAQVAIGTTGAVVGGQLGQAAENVAEGGSITFGLFDPDDIFRDAFFGALGGTANYGAQRLADKTVRALAQASARNGRVTGGVTLLGSFPEYIDLAKMEGATYFDMPEQVWKTLSKFGEEAVWSVNRQFLDDSIKAGHSFVITLGEGKITGRYLQREIEYLLNNGYNWVDGALVPSMN